jgi:hypothetical protein
VISGELSEGARRLAGQRGHVLKHVAGVTQAEQAERSGAFLAGKAGAGEGEGAAAAIAASPARTRQRGSWQHFLESTMNLVLTIIILDPGLFQRGCATPAESLTVASPRDASGQGRVGQTGWAEMMAWPGS